uniref:Thymocyte nuclear protein 1 n=1 Tax=Bionectria ochroleuca TaxID=29856 RepID=A0A8H7NMA8_BIOOC
MPPRKRALDAAGDGEPTAKRRSSRQATAAATASAATAQHKAATASAKAVPTTTTARKQQERKQKPASKDPAPATKPKGRVATKTKAKARVKSRGRPRLRLRTRTRRRLTPTRQRRRSLQPRGGGRDARPRPSVPPGPEPGDRPPRRRVVLAHEGRARVALRGGVDVRFSIDDLRACTKPEGWDGIRNYAARNNLRAMNAGDKAFFYHSNCKTPGIVGTMEIVREHSEDKSARRPGTPYYDPQSTRDKPRWSLVHVEFRRKFAVPILLPELRDLGAAGGPLAQMQMIKQSRLSVSRVSGDEWRALCELADSKAKDAGLEHEDA